MERDRTVKGHGEPGGGQENPHSRQEKLSHQNIQRDNTQEMDRHSNERKNRKRNRKERERGKRVEETWKPRGKPHPFHPPDLMIHSGQDPEWS